MTKYALNQSEAVVAEETYYNQSDKANDRGKYVSWTNEMDRCLTQLLVEQVMLGNKLEKNFKPVAYTAALSVLNDKLGLDLTKERNRMKTWKKQYGLVVELLSHSGFEWDERYKMGAANDSDWNEYIEVLNLFLQIDSMFFFFFPIIYVMFHHCSLFVQILKIMTSSFSSL